MKKSNLIKALSQNIRDRRIRQAERKQALYINNLTRSAKTPKQIALAIAELDNLGV